MYGCMHGVAKSINGFAHLISKLEWHKWFYIPILCQKFLIFIIILLTVGCTYKLFVKLLTKSAVSVSTECGC